MATATCKLMYNITIHMTGYGVRILLTNALKIFVRLLENVAVVSCETEPEIKSLGIFRHDLLCLPTTLNLLQNISGYQL